MRCATQIEVKFRSVKDSTANRSINTHNNISKEKPADAFSQLLMETKFDQF